MNINYILNVFLSSVLLLWEQVLEVAHQMFFFNLKYLKTLYKHFKC